MRLTKLNFTFLFVLSGISLLLISSCKTDPCENKDCGTFGNCVEIDDEGQCRCNDGFEVNDDGKCEVFSVNSYTGTWNVVDTCTNNLVPGLDPDPIEYQLIITQIASNEIEISNLGAKNCPFGPLTVEAIVDDNSFVIKSGTYCEDTANGTLYNVEGAGAISTDGIIMTYHVIFSQFGTSTLDESCQAILTL